ncbi:unnamed protein product [Arctia plantaginis]|uniref:Potassium channel domain-containing protein n=1 Tax=Arctia plantaginis TaxID=874455 RepID=A0A8S1B2L7_ARCPL|nr:unnamed protein product [Arctia plantaginis]
MPQMCLSLLLQLVKHIIAPLSHRWKAAIEKRIKEVSQMTLAAVLRGARLQPGQYWNLSGTFLFTIYVMTALGFGAPVPRTIEGRSAVLVYASLAIPVHFYLMMNAGMCIVVHAQAYVKQLSRRLRNHRTFTGGKSNLDNESPNCSRHSKVLKAPSRCCFGLKIMRCLSVLNACHCVPLAAVVYYLTGACVFGKLEDHEILKVLMFPLEFTTSGGLEHQPGHLRILYAFYVEGAMMLLACAVVTFRRYSTPSILWASQKYRLFTTEE